MPPAQPGGSAVLSDDCGGVYVAKEQSRFRFEIPLLCIVPAFCFRPGRRTRVQPLYPAWIRYEAEISVQLLGSKGSCKKTHPCVFDKRGEKMKVLIMGGTLFFGKRLVALAIRSGWDVTVATRGSAEARLPDGVEHVRVDRHDRESMKAAFAHRTFDVVYDQIGYSPDDARLASEVFSGNIGHYIFTSSAAVYEAQMLPLKESQFNPWTCPLRYGDRNAFSYADGKRFAEAHLFQKAPFPVTAVRLPIVIGEDDYTGRFRFHVERVKKGKPIGIPGKAAKMSFVSADTAGAFLHWTATSKCLGPVNAASHTPFSVKEMLDMIGSVVGKTPVITRNGEPGIRSPYYTPKNRALNLVKGYRHGYQFPRIKEWLPEMIEKVADGE